MPIGIAAGAAGIGAVGNIIAGSQSAKAQTKAANKAADTSLQVANLNADLFRQTRDQNLQFASPFYNNGLLAGNALTDLLLGTHTYNPAIVANPTVPGGGTFPSTGPGGAGASSGYTGPTFAQILAMPHKGSAYRSAFDNFVNYYQAHPNEDPGIASRGAIDALSGDDIKNSENRLRAIFDTYAARPQATTTPTATTPAPAGALAQLAPQNATTSALAPASAQTNPVAAVEPVDALAATTSGAAPRVMPVANLTGPTGGGMQGNPGAMDLAAPIFGPAANFYTTGTLPGTVTASAPAAPAPGTTPAPAPAGTPAPATGATPAPSALSAWDQFRQGTNYQWRFNEGQRALGSTYAARGIGDSGAERIAEIQYGQNFASNELGNYMNLLAGQQAAGLSAAGAVMGVSTNYAGNVAAQNTSAANAAANAALISGQAKANQWGAIGQGIGQLGGALAQFGAGGGFGGGGFGGGATSAGYGFGMGF